MKRFTILVLVFSLTHFLHAQLPVNVPAQGLLAWYSFNGNTQDLSGNGNHLTNFNATLTADRFGNPSAAYSFNGTNAYLINNTPSFIMRDTSTFTISIWVNKPTSTVGVFLMHGSTTNGNFIYNIQGTTTAQFGTNKQGAAWFWAPTTMNLNVWEHFVGVYQNKSMTFYKNGMPVAYNTFTHTAVTSAQLPFHVGRGVSGSYTNGLLDDVGVWNRALSPAEIWDLYQYCPPMIFNQPQSLSKYIMQDAVFSINADTGVTHQWQRYDGLNYLNLSNGGQFSGVNTDSLRISALNLSNDGQSFRCIIQRSGCTEESNLVNLSVQCTTLILQQPVNQSVNNGSNATFSLVPLDVSATFQWQIRVSNVWVNLTDSLQYSGTQTPTLLVSNCQTTYNNGLYRCLISLAGCADTSNAVLLTVISGVGLEAVSDLDACKVYPNPARDYLTIEVTKKMAGATYILLDVNGRHILEGRTQQRLTTVPLTGLPSGLYYLHLQGRQSLQRMVTIQ